MKITADKNIIFAGEAFSSIGNVELLDGRKIKNENLKDTGILLVRSVTGVNEELLKNTPVKFVGTATIGDDHVDKQYLEENGIYFTNAQGCNAQAVAEYVFAAIAKLVNDFNLSLKDKSIGVIGAGNIGSRVIKYSQALGLNVIKNDPPLKDLTGSNEYEDLTKALSADIITLHVPMNFGGQYNTHHLLNSDNLKLIKPGAILINASRGAVIDNAALLKKIEQKDTLYTVLDVWENEPQINLDLLKSVNIATPHIAGYSLEGKVNGTVMIYNALCRFLNIEANWQPEYPNIEDDIITFKDGSTEEQMQHLFSGVYPINKDSDAMKQTLLGNPNTAALFDKLRSEYSYRRELSNYKVTGKINKGLIQFLKEMQMEILP